MLNAGKLRAGSATKKLNAYFCPKQFPHWKEEFGGQLHSIEDTFLFEAVAGKLKQRFLDMIKLVCLKRGTNVHSWKSKNACTFAVECTKCKAHCVYEWCNKEQHNKTPNEDKKRAVMLSIAFLQCIQYSALQQEASEDSPSCMRYAWHHLPQNGQMDTASENEDGDNDVEVEDGDNNVEVEDSDNNVEDEEEDMIYVQEPVIDFPMDDVEHGEEP